MEYRKDRTIAKTSRLFYVCTMGIFCIAILFCSMSYAASGDSPQCDAAIQRAESTCDIQRIRVAASKMQAGSFTDATSTDYKDDQFTAHNIATGQCLFVTKSCLKACDYQGDQLEINSSIDQFLMSLATAGSKITVNGGAKSCLAKLQKLAKFNTQDYDVHKMPTRYNTCKTFEVKNSASLTKRSQGEEFTKKCQIMAPFAKAEVDVCGPGTSLKNGVCTPTNHRGNKCTSPGFKEITGVGCLDCRVGTPGYDSRCADVIASTIPPAPFKAAGADKIKKDKVTTTCDGANEDPKNGCACISGFIKNPTNNRCEKKAKSVACKSGFVKEGGKCIPLPTPLNKEEKCQARIAKSEKVKWDGSKCVPDIPTSDPRKKACDDLMTANPGEYRYDPISGECPATGKASTDDPSDDPDKDEDKDEEMAEKLKEAMDRAADRVNGGGGGSGGGAGGGGSGGGGAGGGVPNIGKTSIGGEDGFGGEPSFGDDSDNGSGSRGEIAASGAGGRPRTPYFRGPPAFTGLNSDSKQGTGPTGGGAGGGAPAAGNPNLGGGQSAKPQKVKPAPRRGRSRLWDTVKKFAGGYFGGGGAAATSGSSAPVQQAKAQAKRFMPDGRGGYVDTRGMTRSELSSLSKSFRDNIPGYQPAAATSGLLGDEYNQLVTTILRNEVMLNRYGCTPPLTSCEAVKRITASSKRRKPSSVSPKRSKKKKRRRKRKKKSRR